MKNGNWMPIDTRLAVFLPKDREYTELEAMYSLQLNYDRGTTVTVAGLAASWQWKRHAVYALLKKVGALVVYQGKRKSRSTGGIIVPVKGACQAHVGDMSCACRAHVRLIKNNKLDNKRSILVASQPHDNNMWATLLSIPQITYSYKDKEGKKNESIGNYHPAPSGTPYGDGYWQYMQSYSKTDGDSYNLASMVNGNVGDSGTEPACEANLNGSLLNGSDNAKPRTGLDFSGPGDHHGIPADNSSDCVGDSVGGNQFDAKKTVGKEGAELDREEVVDANTGIDHIDRRGHGRSGSDDLTDNRGGMNHGNVGQGDNRVDNDNHGGVSLSDKGELNHDILEEKEEDEAKPKPAKKKPKKKNGVVLDFTALDPLIDEDVMKKFVEFRRVEKKKPVKTQRTLEGIATAALTCRDVYGYDPNHCLLYAMQAGANGGWQLPKPEYFKNEKISFEAWLNRRNGQKVARCQDDILSPLERKNKENAEIAAKMMEGMFDEEGRFTGLH